MSEFTSSYLDHQERQNAYEEALNNASGKAQASTAEWEDEIRKFELDKERKDQTYDQLKQTLELLGAPLTEEGVKKLSRTAIEKLKNKASKTATDFVNKYGDQAKAKLQEGLEGMKAKGITISEAMKNRLNDSIDKLNEARAKVASSAPNSVVAQAEDQLRATTNASKRSVRFADQQGLDLARETEGNIRSKFERNGLRKLKSKIGEEPAQVRARGARALETRRNFRGLPKPQLSEETKARLAERKAELRAKREQVRLARQRGIQVEGFDKPTTTAEDLERIRQLTSEPRLDPIKLDTGDYAEISPRNFFQNTSGISQDVVERLENPYSIRNVLGAEEANKAIDSIKVFNSAKERRMAEAAKRVAQRASDISKSAPIGVVKAPEEAKALSADSLYPMREFQARLDKFGTGTPRYQLFEDKSSLSQFRQDRFNDAKEKLTQKLFNPASTASGSMSEALEERPAPHVETNIDEAIRLAEEKEAQRNTLASQATTIAESGALEGSERPTVDSSTNRKQNEAIGESAPPELGARPAPDDKVGAVEMDANTRVATAPTSMLEEGASALKEGALASALPLGIDLFTNTSTKQKLKDAGTAEAQALADTGIKKATSAISGNVASATGDAADLASAGETAIDIDTAMGGPEDVVGDVVSGVVGLGLLLGGIFGEHKKEAPPPPPPRRPVLNPATSLGI